MEPIAPTRTRPRNNFSSKSQRWTIEEDARLRDFVHSTASGTWKSAEPLFPGKTAQQIFERWTKVLDPGLHKGSWTRQEDETIISYVVIHGAKSWTKLADMLPGRIGKQCRERWLNHLNPELSHGPWTAQEDYLLMQLHQLHGNHWSRIASLMPNRADNTVKNRWYSVLAKKTIEQVAEAAGKTGGELPRPTMETSKVPVLEIISPIVHFSLASSYSKVMGAIRSPTLGQISPPSLLENRTELMNLIIGQ
jgi:hypothetical protein